MIGRPGGTAASGSGRRVTVTGGSGFVGRILTRGLREQGYRVDVFDRVRGPVASVLTRPPLETATTRIGRAVARRLGRAQDRARVALLRAGVWGPSGDDVLDLRGRLVERFRGSAAVVHLAGIPHPRTPGAAPEDFWRINYHGSINAFEAARDAGVPRFVFASSAQVYRINDPVRIDQFPILESNHCPTLAEGQSEYGWTKLEVERYLARRSQDGATQSVALRLEFPGMRSRHAYNFYVSTSVENLLQGFVRAIEAPLPAACEVVNLADAHVDESLVDVQAFLRERWPGVPNHTRGNQCPLGTERARARLGFRPVEGGHYVLP